MSNLSDIDVRIIVRKNNKVAATSLYTYLLYVFVCDDRICVQRICGVHNCKYMNVHNSTFE